MRTRARPRAPAALEAERRAPPPPPSRALPVIGNAAIAAAPESAAAPAPDAGMQPAVGNAALAAAPAEARAPPSPTPESVEGPAEAPAEAEAPPTPEGGPAAPGAAPAEPAAEPSPPSEGGGEGAIGMLESSPPSAAADAVRAARAGAQEEVAGDRQRLLENPPTLEAPSGLTPAAPGEGAAREAGPARGVEGAARIDEQQGEGENQAPPDTAVEPIIAPLPVDASALSAIDRVPADDESRRMAQAAQRVIDNLATRDDQVIIDAGTSPRLELTGEADPGQWDQQAAQNQGQIDTQLAEAREEMTVDEGVDDIYPRLPDEILTAEFSTTGAAAGESALGATPGVSSPVRAGFDAAAAAEWGGATANARAEHDAALTDREQREGGAWGDAESQIAEAEAEATAEQRGQRLGAGQAVTGARRRWQGELTENAGRYRGEATAARTRMQGEVGAARTRGEADADRALRRGERDAHAERRRSEREAAAKRREAEARQSESSGFLGWLKSRLKSFLSAIRSAINAIFDALRAAVRGIIEAAKRVAAAAIELARRAAIAAIRTAGRALEVAADVFLAGFPEARDRAKAAIRSAVANAEEAVNRAAEWLRERVREFLDALGAALDAILAAYQAIYNAILDAIEFIAIAFLEIMEGIERLVQGARAMPDHFEGQVEEELIGSDLTQPLPFERQEAAGEAGEPAMPELSPSAQAVLGAEELTDAQAIVDQVADFEPDTELILDADIPDGGERFFGENDDPANAMEAIRADAAAAGTLEEGAGGEGTGEGAAEVEAEYSEEELLAMTDDERLDLLIDQEPEGTCTQEKPSGEEGAGFPEHLKFGPLTRGQRARYLLSQMWKGIRQWFSCNWPWLLAATIAALVGIIILEIVTGGAVTAALPIILSIVAAVMIGVAVVRAASYLGDYLTQSWEGDIQGGGTALARALAIGAVELIFAVLTYITAGAFRVLAGAVRAAGRAAGAAARLAARGARGAARLVSRGARAAGRGLVRVGGRVGALALRNGRIVMRGLRSGFARGARNLRELGRRLSRRLRFRRFSLTRRGRWFYLWGHFNSKVLLASGRVVDAPTPGRPVGAVTRVRGRWGVVIGRSRSPGTYAREAMENAATKAGRAANRDIFRRLYNSMDDVARRGHIYNARDTRHLRRGIPGPALPKFYNAHHLAPRELASYRRFRDFFGRIGFRMEDGLRNGVGLPPGAALRRGPWARASIHSGSHPNYTGRMAAAIDNIRIRHARRLTRAGGDPARVARADARALDELHTLLANTRTRLVKGLELLD